MSGWRGSPRAHGGVCRCGAGGSPGEKTDGAETSKEADVEAAKNADVEATITECLRLVLLKIKNDADAGNDADWTVPELVEAFDIDVDDQESVRYKLLFERVRSGDLGLLIGQDLLRRPALHPGASRAE